MNKTITYFFFLSIILGCSTTNTTSVGNSDSKQNSTNKVDEIDEYYEPEYEVIKNKIYDNDIKTVRAHKSDWELSNAAIEHNTKDKITFSFDKIGDNLGDYYYTIIHCNADWKKSNLQEINYLEGFFQDFINNYSFSFNTYAHYVHYEVTVPNKNIKIKETGNYIFKVFKDNDPEKVVLTKRFIVYENKIITRGKVNRPSKIGERNYKQEVDFELDLQKLVIRDIGEDLKVVVQQNNRWDNAITNLKPLYIRGNQLNFDYNNEENLFDGGNEFRFLDLRNMRYRGQKIQQILLENRETNVFLFAENKRRFKNYLFYEDLDGKFTIKNQFGSKQTIESDYVYTHFALNYPQELVGGEIYVFGGISDYEYRDEFKMTYNSLAKQYETKAFIKQGYYDYYYMYKKSGEPGDVTVFEGDHFVTENMYSITTYLKDFMCNCDRIIGHTTFKSNQ